MNPTPPPELDADAVAAAEPVSSEPFAAEPFAAEPFAAEPFAAEPAAAEPAAAEAVAAETRAETRAETAAGAAATLPAVVELGAEACAAALRERFPALFGGAPRPLKLRIQADIQARAPGVFTKAALGAFLRRHTGRHGYLLALTREARRFDLDGQPAGEVSAEHREAAAAELARRRTLHDQRQREIDGQRRERAALLRDFETSRLSAANFCALKRIPESALEPLLARARQEAAERSAAARPQPPARHGGPRPAAGPAPRRR
jgi:sRNA-binding protein